MPELPTQPDSLVEDDSSSYEYEGATSAENFKIRDAESVVGKLSENDRMRNLYFNVLIPIALLCVGGLAILAFGKVQPDQRPPADMSRDGRLRALPAVRVQKVLSLEGTGQELQLRVDGSVVPFRETRIAAEVAGRIVEKSSVCEAGSYVKTGELLMKIDETDYKLEVDRLSRLQEQEYQALQEVDQEMANSQRLIDVAKQDVALQEKEVLRQKSLPEGFASRGEIDQAERALLQSRQQLVTSENSLSLLKKRRVRLEASEKLAKTQLAQAEANLARCEIKAPIDGVIVAEEAELNSFVARGSTMVVMEDTSKVEVSTNLRMDQLHWVLDQERARSDDTSRGYDLPETQAIIEYQVAGRDDLIYRWQGRLLSYDGIGLDPNTRTVPVRVLVDNPRQYLDQNNQLQSTAGPTALVRGMFVRVKLLIKPQTPLVVIPSEALKPGNRVWRFDADESVLDVDPEEMEKIKAASETVENTPQDGETEEVTVDDFNPGDWAAGKVMVKPGITPVDSLWLDTKSHEIVDRFRNRDNDKSRMWVCEVRGDDLQAGSFVVVSPLGYVDSNGTAARASAQDITGKQPASDEESNE